MTEDRDPRRVRGMFGAIARRYDLLNHLLSANLDRSWRRAAARALPPTPLERVLDLCGGTGDLTLAVCREREIGQVVCCDFSHPMLLVAAEKLRRRPAAGRPRLLEADGLRLPFRSGTFDATTVAFGIRNFENMGAGLVEIHRVLRPGGCLVVLEFSTPTSALLARAYGLYLKHLLPRLGGGGAYGYLARTIAAFPDPAWLAGLILESGFETCRFNVLTGGIVTVHTAYKAAARTTPRPGAEPTAPSAPAAGSRPVGR